LNLREWLLPVVASIGRSRQAKPLRAKGERPYDLAFAVRVFWTVGTRLRVAQRLVGYGRQDGRPFIDGGNTLKEVALGVAANLNVRARADPLKKFRVD
jgi:hypothetical protein